LFNDALNSILSSSYNSHCPRSLLDPELLYTMIFKRKSFHLFRNCGDHSITQSELNEIINVYDDLVPLDSNIRTAIQIVPADQTSCKRGQEYCVLFYSEKKGNYLANIGYLGEQLDLYLVSKNIGTLWFGIGKTQEISYQGLEFVIMIAIRKIDPELRFRKDMFKSKRKSIEEIWIGEPLQNISDIIRFAPSACNTQPWLIERLNNRLVVYRYKKPGKRGIMPSNMVSYYNRIDMGIFLCFLELCLYHNRILFTKELYPDDGMDQEKTLRANYMLKEEL